MNEVWKDIPGYEGSYQASTFGRIRSLPRKHCKGCILVLRDNGYGYLTVGLSVHHVNKRFKVHKLIAMTFIPNEDNEEYINHIDGNKHNNFVSNLEWCNRSYNMKHAYDTGLLQTIPVLQLDLQGNIIRKWKSAKQAYNELKIPNSNIVKCCQNKRHTAGGYIWRYCDEEVIGSE